MIGKNIPPSKFGLKLTERALRRTSRVCNER